MTTEFAWHVHHEVLLEPLTEPIEVRLAYIKGNKPAAEIPLRVRLLHVVKGPLPSEMAKAWEVCAKAREVCNKAWEVCDKALEVYEKAREDHDKAWEVCNKAWEDHDKAWEVCNKAWEDYDKALEVCKKAWEDYDKALEVCEPEIEALHKLECPDCPWGGKTIFPKGRL